jgi:hypothetical protein
MPRHLWACVVALLLLCTPAQADEEYSALRAFGIDEIRLGGMQHNLDVRNNQSGVGYTVSREAGIDVNGEVLFASPGRSRRTRSSISCCGRGRCSGRR